MPDSHPARRRSRDIDISKSPLTQWLRPKIDWVWIVVFFSAVFVFCLLGNTEWHVGWSFLILPGSVALVLAAWLAWNLVVRRGALTWMRLAWAPAKAMARGHAVEAERALHQALERARQFSPHDHRRGLMLVELAGYVKNQGRYGEAGDLFEECVEILAHHRRANPMDYFIALNNYAIYFIHLRDHTAAQRILERVLDLTLARKKAQEQKIFVAPVLVQEIELVLHLNLVFLFVEMRELAEARSHLEEADAIFRRLSRRRQARFADRYRAMRALLLYALGQFADAGRELDKAADAGDPACMRVRAKLQLVRQDFAEAEQLLRKYFNLEAKKGSLHRPELRDHTLDLAEGLFGQGRHGDAFTAFEEARAIVAAFALPPEAAWRGALQTWLQRARELGRADVVASLETELLKTSATPEHGITISARLRVRAPIP